MIERRLREKLLTTQAWFANFSSVNVDNMVDKIDFL